MQTVIEALRQVVGSPDFYLDSGNYGTWDYGAMCEYFAAVLIVCIVISSVFRLLGKWGSK